MCTFSGTYVKRAWKWVLNLFFYISTKIITTIKYWEKKWVPSIHLQRRIKWFWVFGESRVVLCISLLANVHFFLLLLFVFLVKEISSLLLFNNLMLFCDISFYHCCHLLKKKKLCEVFGRGRFTTAELESKREQLEGIYAVVNGNYEFVDRSQLWLVVCYIRR